MSGKRYTEEFKVTAVKPVIDRGHPAAEVAGRPFGAPTSLRKRIDQHFPSTYRLNDLFKKWSTYVLRIRGRNFREKHGE